MFDTTEFLHNHFKSDGFIGHGDVIDDGDWVLEDYEIVRKRSGEGGPIEDDTPREL